jgi:pyruvate dehydrogenase (quinone)
VVRERSNVLCAGRLSAKDDEHPDEVGPAWDEALHADRPCVLDITTDPNVPPLPPHITYEQAKKYTQALLKGDPDAVGIIWQSLKQSMQGVLPSRD